MRRRAGISTRRALRIPATRDSSSLRGAVSPAMRRRVPPSHARRWQQDNKAGQQPPPSKAATIKTTKKPPLDAGPDRR
jgi:hypothetical protein